MTFLCAENSKIVVRTNIFTESLLELAITLTSVKWNSLNNGGALGSADLADVTPQKFSADCERGSDRPTTVGGWMRPTSGLRANGCIYTGLSTRPVRRSTSEERDAAAAERFLAKALGGENHPTPRVINTDKHAGFPPAIVQFKAKGALQENCRNRPVQYLNNFLEEHHRAIKRRVRASQHFRSFWALGAQLSAMRRSI